MRLILLSLVGACCLGSGCASVIPYEPKTNLVAELGEDAAKLRLVERITRSRDWRFNSADVERDYFTADRIGVLRHMPIRVYFGNVERVDIHKNHCVFVRNPSGVVVLKLTFADTETAMEFSDLVASLKSAQQARAAEERHAGGR